MIIKQTQLLDHIPPKLEEHLVSYRKIQTHVDDLPN